MDKYPKKFSSRVFTLNLTLPALLSGMAVLFGGFVFVFMLGLLLGSGYDLEERIPGLESVLPEKSPTPAPVVIAQNEEGDDQAKAADNDKQGRKPAAGSKDDKKNDDAKAAEDASGQKAAARSGLIDQGDLAYRDRLKSDKPAPTRTKPAVQAQKDDKKKKPEPEKKKETPKKSEERFKYIYQAASYKGPEYADKFTDKLKKAGFKARTLKSEDKNVTWYRVMVDFTGTATEADELAQAIQKQGVSKMLLLSKKQVR